MKKVAQITACILVAILLALGALCIYAEQNYSSADDPLISLSYLNEVFLPRIVDLIERRISGEDISIVTTDIPVVSSATTTEAVTEPTTEKEPEVTFPEGTVNTGSQYAVLFLAADEALFASVNSCEVIVRSGKATVVSPFTVKWEEQGVSDVTDGKELYNGESVPNNHMILIPRDDGRGITVDAGGAWVMVRGDFIVRRPEDPTTMPEETDVSETDETDDTTDTADTAEETTGHASGIDNRF